MSETLDTNWQIVEGFRVDDKFKIQRPSTANEQLTKVKTTVENIFEDLQQNRKKIWDYSNKWDNFKEKSFRLPENIYQEKLKQIPQDLKLAIDLAYENIYAYHLPQYPKDYTVENIPGVKCWKKNIAIEKVGLYIPGGSAVLFSTILMLGIPSLIANNPCKILCTPVSRFEDIHPAIVYCAYKAKIKDIYCIGGAQAIAAMTFGVEDIPSVDKVFGPGNAFVTEAKVQSQRYGMAIDLPAGPSELMVLADDTAYPSFVAADLLSQAEHGDNSQVVLISTDYDFIKEVQQELKKQIPSLPKKETVLKSLKHSSFVHLEDRQKIYNLINDYAPEHLIIAIKDKEYFLDKTLHAGSIFIGNYSPESAGDYASGTNHTLPTYGYVRNYSGVNVLDFMKGVSYQEISQSGLEKIGAAIEIMAESEGLVAHKNAVSVRLAHSKKSR